MAHYDCSNCGDYGGISYGICTNCTPKPLLEASKNLDRAGHNAEAAWIEFSWDLKQEFIKNRIKDAQEHLKAMEKLYPRP
jgi:hypothetical protein